jgi:hypothetical protein
MLRAEAEASVTEEPIWRIGAVPDELCDTWHWFILYRETVPPMLIIGLVVVALMEQLSIARRLEVGQAELVVPITDVRRVPEGEIAQFWRMSWTALVPPAIRTQGTVRFAGGDRTRLFKVEIRPVRSPNTVPLGSNQMRGRVVLALLMVTPRSA